MKPPSRWTWVLALCLCDCGTFEGEEETERARRAYREARFADAERHYKRALEIAERDDPQSGRTGESLCDLGAFYLASERAPEAEALLKRALAIGEQDRLAAGPYLGWSDLQYARVLNALAAVFAAQGRPGEATPLCERAAALEERFFEEYWAEFVPTLGSLADLYRAQGRNSEAEAVHRRLLGLWEKALGAEHPGLVSNLEAHADVLRRLGRDAEAANLESRARTLRSKSRP